MTVLRGIPDPTASPRQLDMLERVALVYLLLPLALFIATWLRWPAALGFGLLLSSSTWCVTRAMRAGSSEFLPARHWMVLGAAAGVWVALSGLAGVLPLNKDWGVRMAVLRDLTVGAWPVGYGPADGGESVLRFSMGYYLVPALLGKIGGIEGARAALATSTFVGVALFFALVVADSPDRRWRTVALLLGVLIVFSGLDIVGWWLGCACMPAYGQHIEWWGVWMQYSSQTTLLFWVPNHALPAWLVAGIAWRHRTHGLALAPAALLLLTAAFWSPLACVGLAPLLLAGTLRGRSAAVWLRELAQPAVLAVVPTTLLLAKFVTFGHLDASPGDADATAAGALALTPAPAYWLLTFALLEWGLLAALLSGAHGGACRLGALFWVAVVELAILPFASFGPGNDLVMRGGIAPMTVLVIMAASAVASQATPMKWRRALLVVLFLGSVTPLMEVQRATLPGSRWPDDGRSLVDRVGRPWHYVGVLAPGWLQRVLRPAVPLDTPP